MIRSVQDVYSISRKIDVKDNFNGNGEDHHFPLKKVNTLKSDKTSHLKLNFKVNSSKKQLKLKSKPIHKESINVLTFKPYKKDQMLFVCVKILSMLIQFEISEIEDININV